MFFQGIIHSIHYHRLILDEAHSIKVSSDSALILRLVCWRKSATHHKRRSGLLCTEGKVQMVPLWHACAESDWRVFLSSAVPTGPPVRLLFLQDVQLQGASLVAG